MVLLCDLCDLCGKKIGYQQVLDARRSLHIMYRKYRRLSAKEYDMSITLTERAAARVQSFMKNRGKGVGLRVGVKTSGCSGMAYSLEFADELDADDLAFDSFGVTVLVDPKSMPYLDGMELDYAREGLNEGFKFNNPNVKNTCGCGESFNV
jgi:iron-sulfur cluster assembly protein